MALAKGLALVRHIPMVGIPTLDILAAAQPVAAERMAAVLRAGRGRLAVGWYEAQNSAWKLVKEVEVCTTEELAAKIDQPTFVCGELSEAERDFLASITRKSCWLLRRNLYAVLDFWRSWPGNVGKPAQRMIPASLSPIYLHYNEPIPG